MEALLKVCGRRILRVDPRDPWDPWASGGHRTELVRTLEPEDELADADAANPHGPDAHAPEPAHLLPALPRLSPESAHLFPGPPQLTTGPLGLPPMPPRSSPESAHLLPGPPQLTPRLPPVPLRRRPVLSPMKLRVEFIIDPIDRLIELAKSSSINKLICLT